MEGREGVVFGVGAEHDLPAPASTSPECVDPGDGVGELVLGVAQYAAGVGQVAGPDADIVQEGRTHRLQTQVHGVDDAGEPHAAHGRPEQSGVMLA